MLRLMICGHGWAGPCTHACVRSRGATDHIIGSTHPVRFSGWRSQPHQPRRYGRHWRRWLVFRAKSWNHIVWRPLGCLLVVPHNPIQNWRIHAYSDMHPYASGMHAVNWRGGGGGQQPPIFTIAIKWCWGMWINALFSASVLAALLPAACNWSCMSGRQPCHFGPQLAEQMQACV